VNDLSIYELLQALKNPDPTVRDRATIELWQIWFCQKGKIGLEGIRRSQEMVEAGSLKQAEDLLTQLIITFPDFAEAWNRRAVLYYITNRYQKSLADCETVLRLNQVHFGALHGLGLCYAALGDYVEAIHAFWRALGIQPYAIENQRLILECTVKLT
jgi:tetratricopeptide (TPR) repeat protein